MRGHGPDRSKEFLEKTTLQDFVRTALKQEAPCGFQGNVTRPGETGPTPILIVAWHGEQALLMMEAMDRVAGKPTLITNPPPGLAGPVADTMRPAP